MVRGRGMNVVTSNESLSDPFQTSLNADHNFYDISIFILDDENDSCCGLSIFRLDELENNCIFHYTSKNSLLIMRCCSHMFGPYTLLFEPFLLSG